MGYKLNLGAWNSVFAVPSAVADDYIKLAGGNNLKVLLVVLRNAGNQITVETIARATGVSPDDVSDALTFWEQMGIFTLNNGELSPGKTESVQQELVQFAEKPTAEIQNTENAKKPGSVRTPYFNPGEIARALNDDKAMGFLFSQAEKIYGEPLKQSQRNTLMYITTEAGVTAECALMLVEYCHSEKKPANYMKKIAADWYSREINTAALAEEEIKTLQELNSLENKLKKLFEMKTKFSDEHKAFIRKWASFGYGEEMIDAAYQITLNNAGSMSFPYMNTVICKWNADGIKNKEQLEKSTETFKTQKSKKTKSKSSYDLDRISRIINEK